jgi:hypothetical protein
MKVRENGVILSIGIPAPLDGAKMSNPSPYQPMHLDKWA